MLNTKLETAEDIRPWNNRPVNTAGEELRGVRQARFPVRDVIYHEGSSADTVYAIRSGLVKLLSYLPNGRARIVRLYGKGMWIGLEGSLGRPYEHTAVAVGDVVADRIPTHALLQFERDNPGQVHRLMEKWHEHLAEADRWIADFSTGPIKPRVARLLNFLAQIEEQAASCLVKLLTCDEMAAILGVTPESVSRTLAQFKRSGILSATRLQSPELYCFNPLELNKVAWQ